MEIHREQYGPTGLKRYEVDPKTGCWNWLLSRHKSGYAYSTLMGGRAHRWFYRLLRGPLNADQILHHECENKACVNPWHCKVMSQNDHNILHKTGKPLKITEAERERRRLHGLRMSENFKKHETYTKRTRRSVTKETWQNRTPEERARIGRKISEGRRRKKLEREKRDGVC